eukprot:scaffold145646_cov22-Attheya_sp.AAC.2
MISIFVAGRVLLDRETEGVTRYQGTGSNDLSQSSSCCASLRVNHRVVLKISCTFCLGRVNRCRHCRGGSWFFVGVQRVGQVINSGGQLEHVTVDAEEGCSQFNEPVLC